MSNRSDVPRVVFIDLTLDSNDEKPIKIEENPARPRRRFKQQGYTLQFLAPPSVSSNQQNETRSEQTKQTEKEDECGDCVQLQQSSPESMCRTCYIRKYMELLRRDKNKCSKCGKARKIKESGLCKSCHHQKYGHLDIEKTCSNLNSDPRRNCLQKTNQERKKCKECKKSATKFIHKLCRICYNRHYYKASKLDKRRRKTCRRCRELKFCQYREMCKKCYSKDREISTPDAMYRLKMISAAKVLENKLKESSSPFKLTLSKFPVKLNE